MKRVGILFISLFLFAGFGITKAGTIFWDDFEKGLREDYIVTSAGGEGAWEVIKLEGNSVYKAVAPPGTSTYSTVDDVAGLDQYSEIWATVKLMVEGELNSTAELGLLTNPDAPFEGSWYLSLAEGGAEVGIDESWIAWHNRVPYNWELEQWYIMKVAVIGDTIYGKIWMLDEDEPVDWITSETLTSHLDQDGVGLTVYQNTTYYDDLIVADSEDALAAAVSPEWKLATTWAEVRMQH